MPTAPFRLIEGGAYALGAPLQYGKRYEVSLEIDPGIAPTATESWEIEAVVLSLRLEYAMLYYYTLKLGYESLVAARGAREKAHTEAVAAIAEVVSQVSEAEAAETRAKQARTVAEEVFHGEGTKVNEQKVYEAQVAESQAAEGVYKAKQAHINAKKEAEEAQENVYETVKELEERGVLGALEGIKAGALASSFVEFGPSTEPFLIQDLITHRTFSLVETPLQKEATTSIKADVVEFVDQRFDFSNPISLGEHGRSFLTMVVITSESPKENIGPELYPLRGPDAPMVLTITKAGVQYTARSLAALRREPKGPRPGRT